MDRSLRRAVIAVSAALGLPLAAGGGALALSLLRESSLSSKFESISPGMTLEEVTRLLGPPETTSTSFLLLQREHFEKEYAKAAASGSKTYCTWRILEVRYVVGFGDGGLVALTAAGGT
jgi:hypothetical protein